MQELDAAAGKEEEAASQLLEEREALLEELMDIVCSVDFARGGCAKCGWETQGDMGGKRRCVCGVALLESNC